MNKKTNTGRKATTTRTTNTTKRTGARKQATVYTWNKAGKPDAKTRAAIVATFAALRDAIADHESDKESVAAYERGRKADGTLAELMRAAGLGTDAARTDYAALEAYLLGKPGEEAYAPTVQEIEAAIDEAATDAERAYGSDAGLAHMFEKATVEPSEEAPGVFVMTTAPDFAHAAMFATALAARIFKSGHAIAEATAWGELEADDGAGCQVSWYVENHKPVPEIFNGRKA